MMHTPTIERRKHLLGFISYFFLSTILTWEFVVVSPLYISDEQMLLSTAVAGGKWGIQILLGLLLLKSKSLLFIKNIGFVCFVGSLMLVPYIVLSLTGIADSPSFFVGSLAASVITMIILYFLAVKNSKVPLYWWGFWLICLATAITLQLAVVFRVL